MSTLFQSWKESLSLLAPKNASLVFLVTIKRIAQSYKYLILHGWWVLLLIAAGIFLPQPWQNSYSLTFFQIFCWFLFFFLMYLIVRPSIKHKGFDYYRQYLKYFLIFILLSFLCGVVTLVIGNITLYIKNAAFWFLAQMMGTSVRALLPYYLISLYIVCALLFLSLPFLPLYINPLFTCTILFMLDNRLSIRSFFRAIWQSIKMVIYNWPFFSLMYGVSIFFYALLSTYLAPYFIEPFVKNLLVPIPVSLWTIIYTKRLHDQFSLYYPESVKE